MNPISPEPLAKAWPRLTEDQFKHIATILIATLAFFGTVVAGAPSGRRRPVGNGRSRRSSSHVPGSGRCKRNHAALWV